MLVARAKPYETPTTATPFPPSFPLPGSQRASLSNIEIRSLPLTANLRAAVLSAGGEAWLEHRGAMLAAYANSGENGETKEDSVFAMTVGGDILISLMEADGQKQGSDHVLISKNLETIA
jgi:hypothetical protein